MTRIVTLAISVVALLFLLFSIDSLVEFVGPSEYVRIQYPSGSYSWCADYTTAEQVKRG